MDGKAPEQMVIPGLIANEKDETSRRLLIGTPTRGVVRMEWVLARYGQIIPCNWSMVQTLQYINTYSPMGFMVADAQNVIVKEAIEGNYEWLLLIEDDTCPPIDAFIRFNQYMRDGDIPIVSGLYYTKTIPPEPLVYRGRGNSYFDDFKLGDKVWVDGVPTGMLLIHTNILKLMWNESEEYQTGSVVTRRVFEQPEQVWFDPESRSIQTLVGTSDLAWCDRIIRENVIGRAGWPEIGKKKWPFLVDTNIFCRHISQDGRMYPPSEVIPNMR